MVSQCFILKHFFLFKSQLQGSYPMFCSQDKKLKYRMHMLSLHMVIKFSLQHLDFMQNLLQQQQSAY